MSLKKEVLRLADSLPKDADVTGLVIQPKKKNLVFYEVYEPYQQMQEGCKLSGTIALDFSQANVDSGFLQPLIPEFFDSHVFEIEKGGEVWTIEGSREWIFPNSAAFLYATEEKIFFRPSPKAYPHSTRVAFQRDTFGDGSVISWSIPSDQQGTYISECYVDPTPDNNDANAMKMWSYQIGYNPSEGVVIAKRKL